MKKLFLFLGLALLSPKAWCSVNPPSDLRGNAVQTINFVGAFPCVINGGNQSITTLAPIVCTQGSTQTVTRGEVLGIMTSSITSTAYLVFRDTVPPAVNAYLALQASTVAVVYNYNTFTSSSSQNIVGSGMITFPVPLEFKNGIAVNVDSTFGGALSEWTILYRPLNSPE